MLYYRFADLIVAMQCTDPILLNRAEPYRVPAQMPDLTLCPPASWHTYFFKKNPALTPAQLERITLNQAFSDALLTHEGIVLHASGIIFQQEGLLFSAASGVGKSTHTRLWQTVFGPENVPILNDDQPAIRLKNGQYFTYGTPFSGNSDENLPRKVLLKAIVCLVRSDTNDISRLTPSQALPHLLQLTMVPMNQPDKVDQLLTFLDGLLQTVPVYLLHCTPSAESVSVVYNTLYPPRSPST